jgi:hypothetical protein
MIVASYRQRYFRFKKEVDVTMGRPLGKWGRFKAFFSPNSLSDARKAAIHQAEHNLATMNPETRLYRPFNVIGTTSAAGQLPTVYYRSSSGTFGHITQQHNDANNVGREPARKTAAYRFGNIERNGRQVLEIPGRMHHISRNALRPIETAPQQVAAATAHHNNPAIKRRVLVTGTESGAQFGGLPRGVITRPHW